MRRFGEQDDRFEVVRSDRIETLVFTGNVRPGETTLLTCQPQLLFKPVRLVYKGPPNIFRLMAVYIGRNLQSACPSSDGIRMEFFSPGEKENNAYEAYLKRKEAPIDLKNLFNNLGGCDICQISMGISLLIRNDSGYSSVSQDKSRTEFQVVMYGLTID